MPNKIRLFSLSLILVTSTVTSGLPACAQTYNVYAGVDVQVNEGDPVPSTASVTGVTNSGDDVRDVLGWNGSEKSPGVYVLNTSDAASYQAVANGGRYNVVTLFGCNTLSAYGCANTQSFPQTPAQITGFANYACWVVGSANIPNLRAVTIWNEMNGTYNGGISTPSAQEAAMAALLTIVVPKIRSCNRNVAIYAGAFVGDFLLANWFCVIQEDGFSWSLVDGLDIHPYLSGNPSSAPQNGSDWNKSFNGSVSLINGCAGGTSPIKRPLYFSEWGGTALQDALSNGIFPNAASYFAWFQTTVAGVNKTYFPVAGQVYFLMGDDANFPTEGLYTSTTYSTLTSIGTAYKTAYVNH